MNLQGFAKRHVSMKEKIDDIDVNILKYVCRKTWYSHNSLDISYYLLQNAYVMCFVFFEIKYETYFKLFHCHN